MRGVVLCGGESTRMGSDKGLITHGNATWTEIAVAKLSSLQIPVVVSVNEKQAHFYSKKKSANQLLIDDESLLIKGPLLGILSAHQQFPDDDLLVVACDLINMEKIVLQNLMTIRQGNSHEAFVFTTKGKIQPLCAIYTSSGLKKVFSLYSQQQLKRISMMYVIECLNTKYISADAFAECFLNYNSVEDLSNKSINRVS